uniref:Aa_trans domain-containing protein n=1 Tax=Rhabditophanes sp. KR3021 TaxID=114890 RepID=A0AC35U986_9BILA
MVGVSDVASGQTYSTAIGLLYVFNLIVGTGALALPKAFQTAGYGLSVILLLISALISYISATFIIEGMSVANALMFKNGRSKKFTIKHDEPETDETRDSRNQIVSYDITEKVEVSELSNMINSRFGVFFCYLSLTVYLFGDLAIYSTTVPKSLMNVVCGSVNTTVSVDSPCYEHWPEFFTRFIVYRICVVVFIAFCIPMVIIGITKTKYIQLSTSLSRWGAFSLMVVLASIQLMKDGPQGKPPVFDWDNFGNLFGVSVYSFMCHHSIPALITPIKDKTNIYKNLFLIYALVFVFYCTLSITGAFTFPHAQDIYTLNFLHDHNTSFLYTVMDYFLALFPVFTLTSNYPIVAITLINNLKVLSKMVSAQSQRSLRTNDNETEHLLSDSEDDATSPPGPDEGANADATRYVSPQEKFMKYFIPLAAIILPTLLSLSTDNVLLLACVTGSYPGVGVQFVIPCLIVMGARSCQNKELNKDIPNKYASPFKHKAWPWVVFAWTGFALINVTVNLFSKFTF